MWICDASAIVGCVFNPIIIVIAIADVTVSIVVAIEIVGTWKRRAVVVLIWHAIAIHVRVRDHPIHLGRGLIAKYLRHSGSCQQYLPDHHRLGHHRTDHLRHRYRCQTEVDLVLWAIVGAICDRHYQNRGCLLRAQLATTDRIP